MPFAIEILLYSIGAFNVVDSIAPLLQVKKVVNKKTADAATIGLKGNDIFFI